MTLSRRSLHELRQNTPPAYKSTLLLLFILAVALLTTLPQAPSISGMGRDSGIFAYTAKVISDGGLPYRDAWDNKPPGVYYINALSFQLFGFDRWALWNIELIFTVVTGIMFFQLLMIIYRRRLLAAGGTALFLIMSRHPEIIGDGNFTETYALLPQVLCLYAGYKFLKQPAYRWALLIGLSACFAFLIKQTTTGVAFGFIPAIILTGHPILKSPKKWHWLAVMIMGGLLGLALTGLYFAAHNLLGEAVESAFIAPGKLHNWTSGRPTPLWETVMTSTQSEPFYFAILPFMPAVFLSAAIAVYQLVSPTRRTVPPATDTQKTHATFLLWVLLMFVLDFFLTNLTNRAHFHYYITPIPSMILLSIALYRMVAEHPCSHRLYRAFSTAIALYLVINGISGCAAIMGKVERSDNSFFGPVIADPIVDYIQERTQPSDNVLVWGASSDINFQSLRDSPTQYHYAYAVIVPDYNADSNIQEMVNDLEANQPVMVVDRAISDGYRVPPLDTRYRIMWLWQGGRADTADLRPLYSFVNRHCSITDEVYGAVIYQCSYADTQPDKP